VQELANQLEKRYPLLASLRVAESSGSEREPLPGFLGLLLAAAESEDRRSCCFVFPNTSRVACTAATLSALSKLSHEFDDLAREYAQRKFEPGQRVIIRPAGCVYEYAGVLEAEGAWSKRFQLRVLGKGDRRTLPISDILRLEPTTRKSPKGQLTTPVQGNASTDPLDALIGGIQSWGNRSMLRNQVLYLGSKTGFEHFLSSTSLCRTYPGITPGANTELSDVLPWGTVTEDGSLISSDQYQVEGEPLIAVSHSVENIAEASLARDPFSWVVLCNDPRSLIRNLQACDEIAESQKLIVVASHNDSEATETLKNRGFVVWHVSPEEMNLSRGTTIRSEFSFFSKPLAAARNYRDLKLAEVVCRDESVESVAENLQRASNDLRQPDSDEEAKRCLGRLFNVLFSLSDRCVPLDADEKIDLHDRLNEIRASISRRSNYISDQVEEHISESCVTLSRLISSNTHGLRVGEKKGEILLELLQTDNGHQRNLIVTRHAENAARLGAWLQLQGIDTPVICDRNLSKDELVDQIILTSWLNSERFGKLVKKYTSPCISLLGYPFEKVWLDYYRVRLSKERLSNPIDNGERSAISGIPEELFSVPDIPAEEAVQIVGDTSGKPSIFDIERKILRRRKGTKPSTYSSPDDCESRYVGFADDFYAHLTESREMPVVTALVTGRDPSPGVISERTVDELEVGDFVLFREGSAKGVVQLFAEESIGREEYGRLRKSANVWRGALLARGGSVRELHRLLKSYGLKKTEPTIRSWLQNRNRIGPFSEQDVQIIARATKGAFSDDPNRVWEAICRVRNEHRSAGHQISAWLLEELSGRRNLIADGGGKVDLGFGELQIVEVEEIGTELEKYPAGKVNRLLRER